MTRCIRSDELVPGEVQLISTLTIPFSTATDIWVFQPILRTSWIYYCIQKNRKGVKCYVSQNVYNKPTSRRRVTIKSSSLIMKVILVLSCFKILDQKNPKVRAAHLSSNKLMCIFSIVTYLIVFIRQWNLTSLVFLKKKWCKESASKMLLSRIQYYLLLPPLLLKIISS